MKKVSTFAIFRIFDTKQFVQDTGVRSNTDVGWQGLVHSLTLIHPTGILSGWGKGQSRSSTSNSTYGLRFVHWCAVMSEQKGPSPNCSHKVQSVKLCTLFLS